ncbi:MAG: Peptidyl-prolyl cis-trans isomerase fpr2 [Icmadophila ericetorum]|nr:Peptidyl-prolyl cis-trans isomerase fpr2 [Icmadophila ericetorum]
MRFQLLTISLLATFLPTLTFAEDITIDKTHTVQCTRKSQKGDKIQVHYRGTLTDGTKFDASYDRGTPFSFTLGGGMVIKGWDIGLLDMCPGDKRTLTIPPEFGYGNRGMGPIPAGSTLIFETELISIIGVPKEEPPKAEEEAAPEVPVEDVSPAEDSTKDEL